MRGRGVMFTVEDVVRGTRGALIGGDLGVRVAGVSIDTRTLGVGDAFFAIRGPHRDGHAFLRDAVGRGAGCLVIHTLPEDVPAAVPVVLVDDTTHALGRFASWHRARFSIPVAAVTGSNGKTTTKEMMAGVLGALGPVLKPESSFNNQWGLPLTVLQLRAEHRAVALELGANHPGEIAALAAVSRPTVGVVTMISSAHTEFFGSLDGVQAEKSALVQAIPPDGAVILNADDSRVIAMRESARARVLTFSVRDGADVTAIGPVEETVEGIRFGLETRGERRMTLLRFAGRHNVANAAAAAAVGVALGLTLEDIGLGLERARPVKGRCVWRPAGGIWILDDTYNANPASLRAALDVVAAVRGPRRLVVALADMLELGPIAGAAHEEAGRMATEAGASELVAFGPLSRGTVEAARRAGLRESHHAESFEDAVAILLKRVTPGDVVLVKGSRGMRMERVVDALLARFASGDA